MRASTICGSDLRAIYREHLGEGPEAYQGVVGGHEPCGRVAAVGLGVQRLREGDRVVAYHISGCGQCDECRRGYQISCTSPARAAYGWQRDGGHADLLLDELLTRLDRWGCHPGRVVTDEFALADAAAAYVAADSGATGKVAITWPDR